MSAFPYVWHWRRRPLAVLPGPRDRLIEGGRKGERCRILAVGHGPGPRNVLVEFADGYRVVGSLNALRKP